MEEKRTEEAEFLARNIWIKAFVCKNDRRLS